MPLENKTSMDVTEKVLVAIVLACLTIGSFQNICCTRKETFQMPKK